MPGFDNSGPMGQGPLTGRGLGKCSPKNKKVENIEVQEDFPGRRGMGRGPGRGLANRFGRNRGSGKMQ